MKLSPLLYLTLPLFGSAGLAMVSFDGFVVRTLWPLLVTLFILSLFEMIRFRKKGASLAPPIETLSLQTKPLRVLLFTFAWVIVTFCGLDLCTHGLVLFNSDSHAYATFTPVQSQIRHVSLMCWTLAGIAFVKPLSRFNKTVFLLTALLFPILVVDRNRLLATFAALAMMSYLFPFFSEASWRKILVVVVIIVTLCAVLFSVLGARRSSDSALTGMLVNNRAIQQNQKYPGRSTYFEGLDAACPLPTQLPLRPWFLAQSPRLQWILTYITAPIYNLHTTAECKWRAPDYLRWQIVPLWQRHHEEPPPLPLVSPYLNVGTEFLPFYLASGWMAACTALVVMWLALLTSKNALLRRPDIFMLLIFLRLCYCSVTASFAPQFFTWTTIGFVVLCAALSKLSRYSRPQWL